MAGLTGQSIGRYRIVEQLGQGGMARVYKAFDTRLERDVAFKVIRVDMVQPAMLERMLKRFEREARALAKLNHASIVGIYDYGEYEGAPYLVMEYLPGGTLKAHTGRSIPYGDAARLLLPVTRALAYAHRRDVIHRDVKPANILIDEEGEAKLSDFGIAKILDVEQSAHLTGTGTGIGTPEYMAPEQGMGKTIDHRADIYSLGIVFYELITGYKPFTADTPMAIIFKHISDPIPPPREFAPDLPEKVEQVIFTALAKQPLERYVDMNAFGEQLSVLSEQQPIVHKSSSRDVVPTQPARPADSAPAASETPEKAPPEAEPETYDDLSPLPVQHEIEIPAPDKAAPAHPKLSQPPAHAQAPERKTVPAKPAAAPKKKKGGGVPRWLWISGLGLVALAALGGIASWMGFMGDRGDDSPVALVDSPTAGITDTLQPSITASVTPTQAPTFTPQPTFTAAPTATPILPVVEGKAYPLPQEAIQLQNIERISQYAVWGTGSISDSMFSPDGGSLAVTSSKGIELFSTQDWETIHVIESDAKLENSAFSPDGSMIAGSSGSVLYLFRVADGALLWQGEGHKTTIRDLAFSPDGQTIATVSAENDFIVDNTARIWQVSNGNQVETLEHLGPVYAVAYSPDGRTLATAGGTCYYIFSYWDRKYYGLGNESECVDVVVRLWNASTYELSGSLGHGKPIYQLLFTPDGSTLITKDNDGVLRFWRTDDNKVFLALDSDASYSSDIAVSPDSSRLVANSRDTIESWRLPGGNALPDQEGYSGWGARSINFSPNGEWMVTSSRYQLQVEQLSDGEILFALGEEPTTLQAIAPSLDGDVLISGFRQDSAYFVQNQNLTDGSLTWKKQVDSSVSDSAVSPDGELFAYDSYEPHDIQLGRTSDGEVLHTLSGHRESISSLAFSPLCSASAEPGDAAGCVLASGSSDKSVRLWDAASGTLLFELNNLIPVLNLAFSPDGKYLAASTDHRLVLIWRVADGELVETLKGHTDSGYKTRNYVYDVAFSPDGLMLASAAEDTTVQVWQVQQIGGELQASEIMMLEGEADKFRSVAFSADGSILAAGASDNMIYLWGSSSREFLTVLEGHSDYVNYLDFLSNGKLLVSSAWDNTVRVWGVLP